MDILPMNSSLDLAALAVKLMELLLIGACLSLLGLLFASVAFAAATRAERRSSAKRRREAAKAAAPSVVRQPAVPEAAQPRISSDTSAFQQDIGVRLEGAASAFLKSTGSAR